MWNIGIEFRQMVSETISDSARQLTYVGSTVNVADDSYTNTIGEPLITASWIDPDFNSKQRAFYYVRMIEIPKLCCTAYDAKLFKVEMPKEVSMVVQDRALSAVNRRRASVMQSSVSKLVTNKCVRNHKLAIPMSNWSRPKGDIINYYLSFPKADIKQIMNQ